jgi:hypothetical protein
VKRLVPVIYKNRLKDAPVSKAGQILQAAAKNIQRLHSGTI